MVPAIEQIGVATLVNAVERIGAFAGLAAFIGLAVLALLSFTHGRDIRRLREWAGSAPERDAERKEQTSTIAAQRAEELRALEEARTAEQEAVSSREERRRRREEGEAGQTRAERLRGRFSGVGETASRPSSLVALFVVLLALVGGGAYLLLSGGDEEGSGGGNAKQAAAKVKPSEIEVTVLNGTSVVGLAATYGDEVESKGFDLGAVTNSSASFEQSVVMFKRGHKPEARKVAKQLGIGKVQLMSGEIEAASAGADVALIVGEDNAEATE
ncbi:MAG TPA: LytR C-terminal domain-containing protein [Solirubrobacterales bacterium]|nr:LytR C-terminal domain-containing protein [Solirubrobacterales bacterium]